MSIASGMSEPRHKSFALPLFVRVPATRAAGITVLEEQKQSIDGSEQFGACTSRNAFDITIGAPVTGTAPSVITCRYVFSFKTTPPLNEFVEYR